MVCYLEPTFTVYVTRFVVFVEDTELIVPSLEWVVALYDHGISETNVRL